MAERSSFFDSIDRDRVYYAADFASHLAEYFTNGIFNNGLMVIANDDMTVSVKLGSANINGYKYKLDTNPKKISVANADGILNRIDNIVIRLDLPNRKITAEIVQGSFTENPIAPALERGISIYDLRIAKISIPAGTTAISQDLITDCRFDSNDCGNVICAVQNPDFTDISKQYDAAFNTWFNKIKANLSGDVAGNLQQEIDILEDKVNANTNQIKKITAKKYKIKNLDDPEMVAGAVIDLPFYYETNTDSLDVFLNGEYLHRCHIHKTQLGSLINLGEGSYYEVDENEERVSDEIVISNKIQLTEDWKIDGSDNLEIIVKGEVETLQD